MSLWYGHDPWPLLGDRVRPADRSEPSWRLTTLAILVALLLAACLLGGRLDRPSSTTSAPEESPPALMYDVRRALEQMNRQV